MTKDIPHIQFNASTKKTLDLKLYP